MDLVGLRKHFLFSFLEDATLFFIVFNIFKSYTKNSENNLFYLYFLFSYSYTDWTVKKLKMTVKFDNDSTFFLHYLALFLSLPALILGYKNCKLACIFEIHYIFLNSMGISCKREQLQWLFQFIVVICPFFFLVKVVTALIQFPFLCKW